MEFHKPRITFRPGEITSTRNSDKINESFSKQLNHKLALREQPSMESENSVWPQRFPSNKWCGNNCLTVCHGTLVITFVYDEVLDALHLLYSFLWEWGLGWLVSNFWLTLETSERMWFCEYQ